MDTGGWYGDDYDYDEELDDSEDYYDAFNDQTFGDNLEPYRWEEQKTLPFPCEQDNNVKVKGQPSAAEDNKLAPGFPVGTPAAQTINNEESVEKPRKRVTFADEENNNDEGNSEIEEADMNWLNYDEVNFPRVFNFPITTEYIEKLMQETEYTPKPGNLDLVPPEVAMNLMLSLPPEFLNSYHQAESRSSSPTPQGILTLAQVESQLLPPPQVAPVPPHFVNFPPPPLSPPHYPLTLEQLEHHFLLQSQFPNQFVYSPSPFFYPLQPPPVPPSSLPKPRRSAIPRFLLLTPSERRHLRKIRLQQLYSDHPFSTDYYLLMLRTATTSNPLHHLQKLFSLPPRLPFTSSPPISHPHCLGKLSCISSITPRQVMEHLTIHMSEAPTSSSRFRFRNLLLSIERHYRSFLILQEYFLRRRITPAHPPPPVYPLNHLCNLLRNPDKICRYLQICKGRTLIFRSLPLIPNLMLTFTCWGYLLYVFPLWSEDPFDNLNYQRNALACFKRCLCQANMLTHLIMTIGHLFPIDNNPPGLARHLIGNPLGVAMLICVYQQAETLMQNLGGMLMMQQYQWISRSVAGIREIVGAAVENKLAKPIEQYPGFWQTLGRYPLSQEEHQVLEAVWREWRE